MFYAFVSKQLDATRSDGEETINTAQLVIIG